MFCAECDLSEIRIKGEIRRCGMIPEMNKNDHGAYNNASDNDENHYNRYACDDDNNDKNHRYKSSSNIICNSNNDNSNNDNQFRNQYRSSQR